MNEKIINLGYTTYLQKESKTKVKRTSNIKKLFSKHKILAMCLLTVSMCVGMNFWLIFNFIRILEQSNIF